MTDTPDTDSQPLSDNMRWFLDTIAGPESSGRYDVRYGGKQGPQSFTDFSAHPNVAEDVPNMPGYHSTAAGRYQFLNSTWAPIADKLGLKDFSPKSQDQGAAYLASTEYKRMTGRDLEGDLSDPSRYGMIASSLHGQWPTLNASNIAMGSGRGVPTQIAQAAPQPPQMASQMQASAKSPPQLAQLQQLQQLSLLNNLTAPQTAHSNANPWGQGATSWTNSLLQAAPQQQSPLQTYATLLRLKTLQGNPLLSGLA